MKIVLNLFVEEKWILFIDFIITEKNNEIMRMNKNYLIVYFYRTSFIQCLFQYSKINSIAKSFELWIQEFSVRNQMAHSNPHSTHPIYIQCLSPALSSNLVLHDLVKSAFRLGLVVPTFNRVEAVRPFNVETSRENDDGEGWKIAASSSVYPPGQFPFTNRNIEGGAHIHSP